MTTFKNKSVIINTIALVQSPKFVSPTNKTGMRFLINSAAKVQHWIGLGVIRNIFTSMGFDPKGTPFQKLVGSTLNYLEYTTTPEELAAANGQLTITTPNKREFVVTTAGVRYTDYALADLADSIKQQINAAAIVFSNGWADDSAPASVANVTEVATPSNAAPMASEATITDEEHEEEEVVLAEDDINLDDETNNG